MKYTNFEAALVAHLGFDPKTIDAVTASQKIHEYLANDFILEALLLSVSKLNTDDWVDDIAVSFKRITGIEITKEVSEQMRWNDTDELLHEVIHSQDYAMRYRKTLLIFAMRPLAQSTILLVYACKSMADKHVDNLKIIDKIVEFYSGFEKISTMLFRSFRKATEPAQNIRNNNFLSYLAKKFIEYNMLETLLSFYWYYAYVGESEIAEIILKELPENIDAHAEFQLSFIENFSSWEVPRIEQIKQKYDLVTDFVDGKPNIKLSEVFSTKGLQSLIPLCLYAKAKGSIEVESAVLWHVIKQSDSSAIFDRMKELSGYEVTKTVQRLPTKLRGQWFSEKLDNCNRVLVYRQISAQQIKSCKEAYTVNPHKFEILKALMRIHSFGGNDQDIKKMLEYSIEKISSKGLLIDLARYAIDLSCTYSLKLLASRFILLGYKMKDTKDILGKIMEQQKKLDARLKSEIDFVMQAIEFYKEITYSDRFDKVLYEVVVKRCTSLKATSNKLFSDNELSELMLEKQALEMLQNKEYTNLLKRFNTQNSVSISILDILLQAALAIGKGELVLSTYQALAQKDSFRAAFYNLEVGPYVLARNRNSKEFFKRGEGNTVSTIWQVPGIIENPVNKKTRRIAH